uniref:Sodium/hydrogen exchanger n=1 Tax=Stegastes partitus TaxID=144197 RepID=A0A3B5A188_9TELE
MGSSVFSAAGASCLLVVLLLCCSGGRCELQEQKPSSGSIPTVNPLHDDLNQPQAFPEPERANLPVFTMDYPRIQVPFEFTLWVLLASFAKIGFHIYHKITIWIPESCLLIAIGLIVGAIMHSVKEEPPAVLSSNVFFLYMLPPIVLDNGYFMPTRPFFENVGTVLWYAVVGTLWNSIGIGLSLFAICQIEAFGVQDINLQVGQRSEVMFVSLWSCFLFLLSFCRLFCLFVGLLCLFVVIYCVCVALLHLCHFVFVLLPIFVFFSTFYVLTVDFYLSSISIITCAITMKYYVEENVSQRSCTTIRHVVKMLATVSETLIFFFLGVVTITTEHEWSWAYVLFTLLFAFVWRGIGMLVLTQIVNPFRTIQFSFKDQFGLAYGGLRGAICFALVFTLPDNINRRNLFVTASIAVIIFTVFIQGISIRPIVEYINIRRTNKDLNTINVEVHTRMMEHVVCGIEDLCGQWSHYYWKDKFKKFNDKVLRRILLRDNRAESSIVSLYKKLELQNAIELLDTPMGDLSAAPSIVSLDEKKEAARPKKKFLAADVRKMHDILSKNMYKIRHRTMAYTSKYNLPDNSRAREILIRRHASIRRSLRPGSFRELVGFGFKGRGDEVDRLSARLQTSGVSSRSSSRSLVPMRKLNTIQEQRSPGAASAHPNPPSHLDEGASGGPSGSSLRGRRAPVPAPRRRSSDREDDSEHPGGDEEPVNPGGWVPDDGDPREHEAGLLRHSSVRSGGSARL